MGFLSDIGGMLPAAYAGFNKGVDDVTARQQREADSKYQEEQRARARSMAPIEDEARTSRLKASIKQDKTADIKGDIERTILEDQQKNLPEQLAAENIARELANATKASQAAPALFAMGGQAIATGDAASLNRTIGHLVKSGLVQMPDGRKLEPPVSSAIVEAPSGSVDFVGQPIEGRAIQATMPDGSKQYVSTKFMDDAYKRQVQAADAASVKIIKPGEKAFVPRTGAVVAEGNEKPYGGLVPDGEGGWIDMRPRTGGAAGAGAGTGTGSKAKATATPEASATAAYEAIYKDANVKLEASQIAEGRDYAVRAMRQGAGTPEEAARIALDAALNPSKIVPDVDAKTGAWSGVYRNPAIQGGKEFNLAPNFTTTQDVAKMENGPAILKDAAAKLLDAQGAIIAPNNPQAQAIIRDQFLKAANDPAERAKMLEIAGRGGPQEVAALTRKLDMIATYGPKPAKNDTSILSRLGIGGMNPPAQLAPYVPREGAPEDLVRRASQANEATRKRAEEQAARQAAEAKASADKKAELAKEISWLTEYEARVMKPSMAAEYLNKYGSVLSKDVQRALRKRL